MLFKHYLKNAFFGLKANKFRAFLTILGIIIGISAIMLVMSLGRGAQDLILKEIQVLGSKFVIITPGREPKGPTDPAMINEFLSTSLQEKELEALKKKSNIPNAAKIVPFVMGTASASYQGEIRRIIIYGATEFIAEMYDIYPERGIFFTDEDVRSRAAVAVIGIKIKEKLFGRDEALGKDIKINGRNFRVIGIFPKKGSGSLINFDEQAIVPYTTVQQYLLGTKHFQHILIEADFEKNIPKTVEDIKITLRNLHNITNPEKDDFYIQTQEDIIKQVNTVSDVLTFFLAAVAAISLFVAGIGIMTIMLVSVTERTREIGLRKALGATNKNILNQFLWEAVLLTVCGGLGGILLGGLLSFAASRVLRYFLGIDWPFTFPVSATLMGFGMSALVGLIFGLYPARKASMKSPIEALRYE